MVLALSRKSRTRRIQAKSTLSSSLPLFAFYVWQDNTWEERPIKTNAETKGDALRKMSRRLDPEYQKLAFQPSGDDVSACTRLSYSYKVDIAGLGTHSDKANESPPQKKKVA